MQMEATKNDAQKTKTSSCIEMLTAYKKLSDLPDNHNQLLKDKTVLLFIANLLESKDQEILGLSLDILLNFVMHNSNNHQTIINVFGLFEGLSCLSIKTKTISDKNLYKITFILDQLRTFMKDPRSNKINFRRYNVYNIYLPDLTEDSMSGYEQILLSIKGIVSFVMDCKNNSCIMRIAAPSRIQIILAKIRDLTNSSPMIITFNEKGNKEYVDPFDTSVLNLEYDEQKSYFVDAPLNFVKNTLHQGKNRVRGLFDTWNKFFYW